MYETLHLNLRNIMPSPSTIRKSVIDNQGIQEGLFRFSELKEYLIEHNYPLNVWLSEDQTAINSRIQYSPKNNQLLGFTPPLDENEFSIFSTEDVYKRWKKIVELAKEKGITVEGFSTDGDCRMLKVMKIEIGLPTYKDSNYFFVKDSQNNPLYIQDTINIGTKLKTDILNSTNSQFLVEGYAFARENNRLGDNTNPTEQDLPSEADIENTIGEAIEYVTSIFLEMEIKVDSDIFYRVILKLNKESEPDKDMEIESDEEQAEIENSSTEDTSSDISVHDSSNDPDDFSDLEAENGDTTTKGLLKIELEKYYAVFYDEGWFLGKVISKAGGNEEKTEINFLKKNQENYIWPKKKDIQLVNKQFVFYGPIDLSGNDPFTLKRTDKLKIDINYKRLKL
ncbi:hypothetical protein RI129_002824 [Pyrocoelia pectoralis]|uniref:Uncharacterized protein n=1 Tax=Pyrocoelia pectoralis TaxID=417401 RepID=A0AAN7ZMI4_9COLE